jgi:putative two-component system response regulator
MTLPKDATPTTHNHPASATDPASILVVDDSPENLMLMSGMLEGRYRVKVAKSGERALALAAAKPPPDLILLDVMMPQMDGYEVCDRLKANPDTASIPVIFLTARTAVEDETHGFDCGAVDFITKPVNPATVLSRVNAHLQAKRVADFLRGKNDFLEAEVQRRTQELTAIQDVTIMVMTSLAETRDNETGNHIRRTQNYVKLLAQTLRARGVYTEQLSDRTIALLYKSAPLHDIGKVGIPDNILLKPAPLTPEEWVVMRTHTSLGRASIERAEAELGLTVDFLQTAKDIAAGHHERWDGTGYPEGLAGEHIPLAARLMALADVYDALISRRVYKAPMSHEEAMRIIAKGRGSHFDPQVVDAFMDAAEAFRDVAARYSDD